MLVFRICDIDAFAVERLLKESCGKGTALWMGKSTVLFLLCLLGCWLILRSHVLGVCLQLYCGNKSGFQRTLRGRMLFKIHCCN